jgi:hypothetical protein
VARRQTLIELDDARLAALDERAAASGRSRSDLVREAIDLLLGRGDAAAVVLLHDELPAFRARASTGDDAAGRHDS